MINLLLEDADGEDLARSLTRACRAHTPGERFLEERGVQGSLVRSRRLPEEVGSDPLLAEGFDAAREWVLKVVNLPCGVPWGLGKLPLLEWGMTQVPEEGEPPACSERP